MFRGCGQRKEDCTILSTFDFWATLRLEKNRHYKKPSPEPEAYQLITNSPVSPRRNVMLNKKKSFNSHG